MELMSENYFEEMRRVLERDCKTYDKTLECYQYAQFLEYRDKAVGAARPLYERLCSEREHGPSCLSAGMIALATKGEGGGGPAAPYGQAAFELFNKACTLGEPKGCQNAGLLRKEGGHGVGRDVPAAIAYFDKACDGGERNGCYYMGLMHLTGEKVQGFDPDKMKALAYSSKACKLGHPWACANASRMLKIGDGVPVDLEQAQRFKDRFIRIQRGELS